MAPLRKKIRGSIIKFNDKNSKSKSIFIENNIPFDGRILLIKKPQNAPICKKKNNHTKQSRKLKTVTLTFRKYTKEDKTKQRRDEERKIKP